MVALECAVHLQNQTALHVLMSHSGIFKRCIFILNAFQTALFSPIKPFVMGITGNPGCSIFISLSILCCWIEGFIFHKKIINRLLPFD